MQKEGIYVTGFYYPVVPKGQARIRVQLSAGHNREQLDRGIALLGGADNPGTRLWWDAKSAN